MSEKVLFRGTRRRFLAGRGWSVPTSVGRAARGGCLDSPRPGDAGAVCPPRRETAAADAWTPGCHGSPDPDAPDPGCRGSVGPRVPRNRPQAGRRRVASRSPAPGGGTGLPTRLRPVWRTSDRRGLPTIPGAMRGGVRGFPLPDVQLGPVGRPWDGSKSRDFVPETPANGTCHPESAKGSVGPPTALLGATLTVYAGGWRVTAGDSLPSCAVYAGRRPGEIPGQTPSAQIITLAERDDFPRGVAARRKSGASRYFRQVDTRHHQLSLA